MSEDREAPLESEGEADELKLEEEEVDLPTPKKKAQAIGEILEGKRSRKTTERLQDLQVHVPKEKLKIENGGGDKLGDIPRTAHLIAKMKHLDLKPLHLLLFDRPGKMTTLKRNMRQFNGFTFEVDSEPYIKKREKILRNSTFNASKLKVICKVLSLGQSGTQSELADRILSFLISPRNSGKPIPPKKKKSKKNLSGSDSPAKTKKKRKSKPNPRDTLSSPKKRGKAKSGTKSKAGSKSKAIVMDMTSSDESDSLLEKSGETLDASDSDSEKKPIEEKEKSIQFLDDSDDSVDEDEKSTSVKRQRAPEKKTGPPQKKAKRVLADQSEADSDCEVEEKLKKKNGAKTKKADSSSNRKKTTSTVTEDSSDDDEPLIKMIKKAPSDKELTETVQKLLKEANLEEMTMKQICQRVYDTYPDHDLAGRKDYIKQTVKTLIT